MDGASQSTADTRIFSVRLYLSTEFSIDPNVLIQLTLPSRACLRMFWICIFHCLFISAYLHRIYTQKYRRQ